jgi:hypothetical protein
MKPIKTLGLMATSFLIGLLTYHLYKPYKVGDCLTTGGAHIYMVTEVGRYGLRAVKSRYNDFEEIFIDNEDREHSHKMDCFGLFDNYGKGNN